MLSQLKGSARMAPAGAAAKARSSTSDQQAPQLQQQLKDAQRSAVDRAQRDCGCMVCVSLRKQHVSMTLNRALCCHQIADMAATVRIAITGDTDRSLADEKEH